MQHFYSGFSLVLDGVLTVEELHKTVDRSDVDRLFMTREIKNRIDKGLSDYKEKKAKEEKELEGLFK